MEPVVLSVSVQARPGTGTDETDGLTLAFASGAPSKISVIGLTQIVIALVFDVYRCNRAVNIGAEAATARHHKAVWHRTGLDPPRGGTNPEPSRGRVFVGTI